jgi:hypothetical protein
MCENGIGLFTDRILHLYSFVLSQTNTFHERTYAPFLNHYIDFMTPEFAKGYVRILKVLWDVSNSPLISQVMIAGLYSTQMPVAKPFLRVVTICGLGGQVDVEILRYHLQHFTRPNSVITLLLKQPHPNIFFLPFLKPFIPTTRGAVALLCRLAEEDASVHLLVQDLDWMLCEPALPIVLVLLRSPEARPKILGSVHFELFRGKLVQREGVSDRTPDFNH